MDGVLFQKYAHEVRSDYKSAKQILQQNINLISKIILELVVQKIAYTDLKYNITTILPYRNHKFVILQAQSWSMPYKVPLSDNKLSFQLLEFNLCLHIWKHSWFNMKNNNCQVISAHKHNCQLRIEICLELHV